MPFSNPWFLLAAVVVVAVVSAHHRLSRREPVWLGAIVPTIATLGLLASIVVVEPTPDAGDLLGPVVAILLLLWTWRRGYADTRQRSGADED